MRVDHLDWEGAKKKFLYGKYTIKMIAAEMKLQPHTVRVHLHKLGVNVKQPMLNYDLTAAREAYAKGMTYAQISQQTGMPLQKLVRALKTQGHKTRTKSQVMTQRGIDSRNKLVPPEAEGKIRKAIAEFKTAPEVARMFDVCPDTIRRWAREHGLSFMTKREHRLRHWQLRHEKDIATVPWPAAIEYVRAGWGIEGLSKLYAVSPQVIKMGLSRNGIDPKVKWSLRGLNVDQIVADHVSGLSVRALGKKYKRSDRFIRTLLAERKVLRLQRIVGPIDFCPIMDDLKAGMTFRQLSKKYHHGEEFLRKHLLFDKHRTDGNLTPTQSPLGEEKSHANVYNILSADGRDVLDGATRQGEGPEGAAGGGQGAGRQMDELRDARGLDEAQVGGCPLPVAQDALQEGEACAAEDV